MIPPNDGRLLHEMFRAYRSDLEAAALEWLRAAIAASPGAPNPTRAAATLARCQRALDQAHPFLPRRHVKRLQSRLLARWSHLDACDGGLVMAHEVAPFVEAVLCEAEWAVRETEEALDRQRVDVLL